MSSFYIDGFFKQTIQCQTNNKNNQQKVKDEKQNDQIIHFWFPSSPSESELQLWFIISWVWSGILFRRLEKTFFKFLKAIFVAKLTASVLEFQILHQFKSKLSIFWIKFLKTSPCPDDLAKVHKNFQGDAKFRANFLQHRTSSNF